MRKSGWALSAVLAVVVIILLVVIWATRGPQLCARCELGIVNEPADTRPHLRPRCVLNGREIDCSKVPGKCPDCGE